MSIAIRCEDCGFQSAAVDGLAGRSVRCRQCGGTIHVPRLARPVAEPPDDSQYAVQPISPPLRFGPPPSSSMEPRRPRPPAASPPTPKARAKPRQIDTADPGSLSVPWLVGAVAGFALLAGVTLALIFMNNGSSKGPNVAGSGTGATGPVVVNSRLPNFPETGPATQLEPGVNLHEIRFQETGTPGHRGKLWLYMPAGQNGPRALPCVLMAGAGSNLLTGMDLGDGDRAEHLPYVRAGFAVLAYELDGASSPEGSDDDMRQAFERFRDAQAGLTNAHIALEYLLAKVPAVDPARIYSSGHSSAGTLSVLFAEHEPRLAGCVAFAPVIDLDARFGPVGLLALGANMPGVRDFVTKYSPRNHEADLACPLFLFHAEDDSNVPADQSREAAERLKGLGKTVTLERVPTGNHYDSMIQQGLPKAIAWMTTQMSTRGLSSPTPPSRVPSPVVGLPSPGFPVVSMPPFPPGNASTPPPPEVPFSVAPPVSSTPRPAYTPPNSPPYMPPPPPRFDPRLGRRRRY